MFDRSNVLNDDGRLDGDRDDANAPASRDTPVQKSLIKQLLEARGALPSRRSAKEIFNVSRGTANAAYKLMVSRGWLTDDEKFFREEAREKVQAFLDQLPQEEEEFLPDEVRSGAEAALMNGRTYRKAKEVVENVMSRRLSIANRAAVCNVLIALLQASWAMHRALDPEGLLCQIEEGTLTLSAAEAQLELLRQEKQGESVQTDGKTI